jgi:hypothetical protein
MEVHRMMALTERRRLIKNDMVSENALDLPFGINLIERLHNTLDSQFRRHILGEIPYPGSWGSSRNAEFHYTPGVPFIRSLPNLW